MGQESIGWSNLLRHTVIFRACWPSHSNKASSRNFALEGALRLWSRMPLNFTKHSSVERVLKRFHTPDSITSSHPSVVQVPSLIGILDLYGLLDLYEQGSLTWSQRKTLFPPQQKKAGAASYPKLFFLHDEWCIYAHSLMRSLFIILLLILLEQMGGVAAASSVFD